MSKAVKIYIEPVIPACGDLKILLENNGYQLSEENIADIFIRYTELTITNQKLPYAVFVEKCENGIFEKTVFLHYADLIENYPNFSSFFHPKNTSGVERLFLYDESICMHTRLPWDGHQILEILDNFLKK